jgi:hypothetical protein
MTELIPPVPRIPARIVIRMGFISPPCFLYLYVILGFKAIGFLF